MPSTAVYFAALPSRIALIAASLMLSGVSKSGSPAPRPMTSRPAALSARALSVTAMVADGLMRMIWSAIKAIAISDSPFVKTARCRKARMRAQASANPRISASHMPAFPARRASSRNSSVKAALA